MGKSFIRQNYREVLEWRSSVASSECESCGERDFIEDPRTGDTICQACGLILSSRNIDPGREWRSFSFEEERSKARTGAPSSPLLYDKGLTTRIGRSTRNMTPEQVYAAKRLQRTDIRNKDNNVERNLKKAFDIMKIICSRVGISEIAKSSAAVIYRKAVEMKLSRGRPMDALLCACLFSACKNNKTPKPIEEFYRYADEGQIKNCLGLLVDRMDIKLLGSSPKDFVEEIANKGVISFKSRSKAYRILDKLETVGIPPSRDPRGFAAAALYIGCLASDEGQTQRDLAVYSGLTEVTVRNRINDIKNTLIIKMPEKVSA